MAGLTWGHPILRSLSLLIYKMFLFSQHKNELSNFLNPKTGIEVIKVPIPIEMI